MNQQDIRRAIESITNVLEATQSCRACLYEIKGDEQSENMRSGLVEISMKLRELQLHILNLPTDATI